MLSNKESTIFNCMQKETENTSNQTQIGFISQIIKNKFPYLQIPKQQQQENNSQLRRKSTKTMNFNLKEILESERALQGQQEPDITSIQLESDVSDRKKDSDNLQSELKPNIENLENMETVTTEQKESSTLYPIFQNSSCLLGEKNAIPFHVKTKPRRKSRLITITSRQFLPEKPQQQSCFKSERNLLQTSQSLSNLDSFPPLPTTNTYIRGSSIEKSIFPTTVGTKIRRSKFRDKTQIKISEDLTESKEQQEGTYIPNFEEIIEKDEQNQQDSNNNNNIKSQRLTQTTQNQTQIPTRNSLEIKSVCILSSQHISPKKSDTVQLSPNNSNNKEDKIYSDINEI